MSPHRPRLAILGATLLGAVAHGPARAEAPLSCEPARLAKVVASKRGIRLIASAPRMLYPMATGLLIELATEAEADPGAVAFRAELPAAGFTAGARFQFRYRDPRGSISGVTRVKLRPQGGGILVAVSGRDPLDLPGPSPGGLHLALTAGPACVHSCRAPCRRTRGGRLRCKRSPADPLCGLRPGCEPLGVGAAGTSRSCLLPYPSNFFTVADATTETGRRIAYPRGAMPTNREGVHVDPTPYNKLDGFSPGPLITVHFPGGVDLVASRVPPLTDLAASLEPTSPTLLVEADAPGCVRIEHFGENDVSAGLDDRPVAPPDQVFMIRPARRLKNGTRYLVALRGLVDQTGAAIPAGPVFRLLRDGGRTPVAALTVRRAAVEANVAKLESDCGVARDTLVLAWDFTTASDASIQRYLLHMRDQTFAQLPGTTAPAFAVERVRNGPFDDPYICRTVRGRFSVPLWTTFNGPGSVLNLDPATNLPVQNGVADDVPFTVQIPCRLVAPTPSAGRPVVYGHEFLGSGAGELLPRHSPTRLSRLADARGFVLGASDWQGFSESDRDTLLGVFADLSRFPQLSERLHQGVLNHLVLARLMRSPSGLVSHPAFQVDGVPLIDTSDVFYYGSNLGGIQGGVVMALSQEITRGVLGAAANYSTILDRSRDLMGLLRELKGHYDPVTRALLVAVIQQLWDRSEPNGWYPHTLAGSLPNTSPHKLVVLTALFDDSVPSLATEIMVRSLGVPQIAPVNRSIYGVTEVASPFDGSGYVELTFWSLGGPFYPPVTNVPPGANYEDDVQSAAIQALIDRFLRTDGRVESSCTGPCDPD